MDKKLMYKGRLALTIALFTVFVLTMPVFAVSGESVEDTTDAEEVYEEVVIETDEQDLEIASSTAGLPTEEMGVVAESDMEETIPQVVSDPAEQSEEEEEISVNGSDTEEFDEEAVELPPTDLEEAATDFPDEPIESSEEPGNEETDIDTETESFIVRFNLCGHGVAVEPISVTSGDTLEKPDDPQDEGFTFIGWYREDSCERKWDFETDTVTEDITLYAGWEENIQEELTEQSTEQAQDDEETLEILEAVEEPTWTLSIPGSQAITYKAERTEIGKIAVKDASHFADGQAVSVTLDYSSFNSDDYSIPIVITVIQNGTESVWNDGTSYSLKPDGSDPIIVYVNISAEVWDAAPHGSYAMSIQFRSALLGR